MHIIAVRHSDPVPLSALQPTTPFHFAENDLDALVAEGCDRPKEYFRGLFMVYRVTKTSEDESFSFLNLMEDGMICRTLKADKYLVRIVLSGALVQS